MIETPTHPDGPDGPPQAEAAGRVFDSAFCIDCGYELVGLRTDGVCPECGRPVDDSLRGAHLIHRSPEYVRTLTRGIGLVLNGILLWFAASFLLGPGVMLAFTMSSGMSGTGAVPPYFGAIQIGIAALNVAISGMILYGYWCFTARDPGDPVRDGAPTARRVVRGAVIAQAAFQVISLVTTAVMYSTGVGQGFSGATPGQPTAGQTLGLVLLIVGSVVGLGAFAAWVTQFFAAMLYVKTIALRLPDPKIYRLSKSRIIACPIWCTVGILLIGLGPLIALILYWNLLNMVRTRLKQIRNAQQHAMMDAQFAD